MSGDPGASCRGPLVIPAAAGQLLTATALQKPGWRGAGVGLACALLVWLLGLTLLVGGLEDWALDACFAARGRRPTAAKVVLVALDDASLAAIPRPLVFLSPELAKVTRLLQRRGARAIGLDLFVPNDLDGFPKLGGDELGTAIQQAGNVVLPKRQLPDGHWQIPLSDWWLAAPRPPGRFSCHPASAGAGRCCERGVAAGRGQGRSGPDRRDRGRSG